MTSQPRAAKAEDQFALAEVANLYYARDMTQAEIAQQLGVSRSNVSRLLKEARRQGMVEIRIHSPLRTSPALQRELASKLGLKECLVLSELDRDSQILEDTDTANQVAEIAARYLWERLEEGNVVSLGWGRSVYRVAHSRFLRQRKRRATVVQAMGSIGGSIAEFDGVATTARLAGSLGANAYYLHSPMLVADKAVRAGLLRDPHIRKSLEVARRSDTLVSSIGTPTQDHGQHLTGYLSGSDLEHIRDQGAVGDICGSYFGLDGSDVHLEMNERSIALGHDSLRKIPERIGVGSGPEKPAGNIGAARSGLINVLITDEETAGRMLDMLDDRVRLSGV